MTIDAAIVVCIVKIVANVIKLIKDMLFPPERLSEKWRSKTLREWNDIVEKMVAEKFPNKQCTFLRDDTYKLTGIMVEGDAEPHAPEVDLYYFTVEEIEKHCPTPQSVHKGHVPRTVVVGSVAQVQTQAAVNTGGIVGVNLDQIATKKPLRDERSAVLDSVYSLVLVNSKGDARHQGFMMFVNSSLAVMPKHYRAQFRAMMDLGGIDTSQIIHVVNTRNPSFTFTVPFLKFMQLAGKVDPLNDVEFVSFASLKVRAHRNITGSFIRETDIPRYCGHGVRLDVSSFDSQNVFTHRIESCSKVSLVNNLESTSPINRAWEYTKAKTFVGDCGSPLTLIDTSCASGRIVLGMHIAARGTTSQGYSSVITQEMIQDAIEHLSEINDNFVADLELQGFKLSPCEDPFPEMGSFMNIGKIDAAYNLPRKTKYYPIGDVYGMFGEYNYLPARLSPFERNGEIITPMLNAVQPYSGPVYHYHHEFIDQAIHVAMSRFTAASSKDTRMILPIETAILGDPMMKLRSIPRNTSPGFPHALTVKNGKKKFFGEDAEYDLTSEEFETVRERVEHILTEAKKGQRLCHVFIDFLKDELRSEEKVEAGKTRLISCAPMEYTIAVRMMFGAFTSSFFRHHTTSGMCPGICAYTDWALLAHHIQKKGPSVFDGDFAGFDTSEQADILERLCDFINKWYDDGPDNARIRKVLFMELTHSRHLGGDGKDQSFIYQWNRSLPSGHPLTTIMNSMYALSVLAICYVKITGDLVGFWEKVSAAVYGDDNLVNVSDEVKEAFNQVTVSQAMDEVLGMKYTSGRKDGKLEPYTTLDKVTFLQRGFRREDGYMYSPLKLESFLYTPYWGKNRMLERQIVADCMEKSLEELSQHDDESWGKYAPQIIEYLVKECGVMRAIPTKKGYQTLIRSYDDHWY